MRINDLGSGCMWATARMCINSADLKMLLDRLGPPSRSRREFNCFDRSPSPASPLMGSDPQFEEDALEKAVLKNTKSKENQKSQHIHIGRKHAVSARRSQGCIYNPMIFNRFLNKVIQVNVHFDRLICPIERRVAKIPDRFRAPKSFGSNSV